MPILETKKCPRCGMLTMHEYVAKPGTLTTYWRCRSCGDRRDLERILISPDASYHPCTIQKGKVTHEANLIDISPAGARFRFSEVSNVLFLQLEDKVLFNPLLFEVEELSLPRPAVIRWFKRRDYGVKFDTPVNMTSEVLRRMLGR